jgi:NodT family efflux transporter outer membrane factor (OMF) lipoprotein
MKGQHMPKQLTLLFIFATLAGCSAIGPDYQPSKIEAPANWADHHGGAPELQATIQATATLPADRWAVFEDSELTHLQTLARQANQDVKTAALRVLQSRVTQTVVSAQRGAQVNAHGGISRQGQSQVGANEHFVDAVGPPGNQQPVLEALASPFTLYQAGFDASWEPDLWGRVLRSEEEAQAKTEVQQASLRFVQLSVDAELARSYFYLRMTQRHKQLSTEQLTVAIEMENLLTVQRDTGLSDDSSVIRQRSQVAGLRASIQALLAQEAQAINRITLLCGAQPGTLNEELAANRMSTRSASLPDLKLGLPSQLAHHRPDIAEAEARLHAATARIGIAKADLYPRIVIGADVGYESVDGSKFGEWGSRQWSIGPSLSLPLFDQGRRRSIVTLRELQQQEAAVAYQQTVLKAWHEVDDAISAYIAEIQRGIQVQARVKAGEDEVTLARARHENGLTTYVPVLNATTALLNAQREEAESTARINTALAAIYKALGDY